MWKSCPKREVMLAQGCVWEVVHQIAFRLDHYKGNIFRANYTRLVASQALPAIIKVGSTGCVYTVKQLSQLQPRKFQLLCADNFSRLLRFLWSLVNIVLRIHRDTNRR